MTRQSALLKTKSLNRRNQLSIQFGFVQECPCPQSFREGFSLGASPNGNRYDASGHSGQLRTHWDMAPISGGWATGLNFNTLVGRELYKARMGRRASDKAAPRSMNILYVYDVWPSVLGADHAKIPLPSRRATDNCHKAIS